MSKTYLEKYSNNLESDLEKLEAGIPVQYIIGNVDFYNGNYIVNSDVLIPRFETEYLVDKILEDLKGSTNKIIDLGTGSGCIAIELYNLGLGDVTGVDISSDAIKVAKLNNKRNNANVKFIIKDMLDTDLDKYDVIVSNPPYIAYDEEVEDIVKNNEPNLALYADNDGMYYYMKIIDKLVNLKNKKVYFEIGSEMKEALETYIKKTLPHAKYIFSCDLTKRDRYLFIYV
jgi:release factor glutamine methyltransferase